MERTATDHGHLDLIFNNAGIGIGGVVSELALAHFERAIDVNLLASSTGCWRLTRSCAARAGGTSSTRPPSPGSARARDGPVLDDQARRRRDVDEPAPRGRLSRGPGERRLPRGDRHPDPRQVEPAGPPADDQLRERGGRSSRRRSERPTRRSCSQGTSWPGSPGTGRSSSPLTTPGEPGWYTGPLRTWSSGSWSGVQEARTGRPGGGGGSPGREVLGRGQEPGGY